MWIDTYDAANLGDFDRDIRQALTAGVDQVLGRGPSEKAQVAVARARWVDRDLREARRDLQILRRQVYAPREREVEGRVAELEAELERLLGVIQAEEQARRR